MKEMLGVEVESNGLMSGFPFLCGTIYAGVYDGVLRLLRIDNIGMDAEEHTYCTLIHQEEGRSKFLGLTVQMNARFKMMLRL